MSTAEASHTFPTHVIVGIDFGMTGTGVAIGSCCNGKVVKPSVIQTWPGGVGVQNKVPTQVTYKAGTAAHLHSVGFECPKEIGDGMTLIDMFKFHLYDAALTTINKNNPTRTSTPEDVKLWYTDFLTALHRYINYTLRDTWKVDITQARVEYIFSLPTSWQGNGELVKKFGAIIEESGFGKDVKIDLTEGEAAAVFTATHLDQKFKKGDAFIVCDAGGGTTDMCVLQVKQVCGDAVELESLTTPKVIAVGSVNIDELFEAKIKEKIEQCLEGLRGIRPEFLEHTAHDITRNQFQIPKKLVGTGRRLPIWSFKVPTLVPRGIDVSFNDIQAMFDEQIEKMFTFIDNEISLLQKNRDDVNLLYLVLAGGLGSSEYVQAKMIRHYKDIEVLFSETPADLPLAVCKGLVIDRLQHLSNQVSVIPIRSSNVSYGILYSKMDSQTEQTEQPAIKHLVDGKKYAANQIDWLIFRGPNREDKEVVTRRYSRILTSQNQTHSWQFTVVRSTLPKDKLPATLTQGSYTTIFCYVVGDVDELLDNRGVIRRRGMIGRRVLQLDYEFSAIVKPGELKFRANTIGQPESEAQELQVQWPGDLTAPG